MIEEREEDPGPQQEAENRGGRYSASPAAPSLKPQPCPSESSCHLLKTTIRGRGTAMFLIVAQNIETQSLEWVAAAIEAYNLCLCICSY